MSAPGAERPVKLVAVAIGAVLLSFQVVRTAAVADREAHSDLAAKLWSSHPAVLTDRALISIATAAARGEAVSEQTRADMHQVAVTAPLSPDPFLIEGAIAQTQKRVAESERLLLEARSRDPRSRATRFLLAERYFTTGRITAALIEMQALVGLQSRGLEVFVPALVGYARLPGAVPQLKAFFRQYPRLEPNVLALLSLDAANTDIVLALANQRNPVPDWRVNLVSALVSSGQYAKAYSTWGRVSGINSKASLFNPGFAEISAPPPFNWSFEKSTEGVAEPDGKGGLSVLYYGRANSVFAKQLLLLSPGPYRLVMQVDGVSGETGALHWEVRCANADRVLTNLPARAGTTAAAFAIPADCPAQWLQLSGVAGDTPQTSELKIGNLQLGPGAGR